MNDSKESLSYRSNNLYIVVNKKDKKDTRYLIVSKGPEYRNFSGIITCFTTLDGVNVSYVDDFLAGKVYPLEYADYRFFSKIELRMFLREACKSSLILNRYLYKYKDLRTFRYVDLQYIQDILNGSQSRERKSINNSIKRVRRKSYNIMY